MWYMLAIWCLIGFVLGLCCHAQCDGELTVGTLLASTLFSLAGPFWLFMICMAVSMGFPDPLLNKVLWKRKLE